MVLTGYYLEGGVGTGTNGQGGGGQECFGGKSWEVIKSYALLLQLRFDKQNRPFFPTFDMEKIGKFCLVR